MNSNARISTFTFVVAFMLTFIPLPDWAQALRPDWVTLVLFYWIMALPASIGVTIAWLLGLLLDVAHGAVLGQHALGLVLVSYIVYSQHQRMRLSSLLQQALVIFFLLILKQLMVLWVYGIIGQTPDIGLYFAPSLIGALFWPWIYIILSDLRRKYGYRSM